MVRERRCLRFKGIPGSLSQSEPPSLSVDLSMDENEKKVSTDL